MSTIQEQARALGDPTRHAIFRYILDSGAPVGVGELTSHFGLNHNAVRQHLTKLVADADRGVLVGATSAGPWGGEVLSGLAVAIHGEVPVDRLRHMIYAYPTFHRGIGEAVKDLG